MLDGSFLALGAGLCRRGNIPCPLGFLLAIKMNVTVGHKIHVFAIPGHFYGSYTGGGTLGYEVSLRGPAPKDEKKTNQLLQTIMVDFPYLCIFGIIDKIHPILNLFHLTSLRIPHLLIQMAELRLLADCVEFPSRNLRIQGFGQFDGSEPVVHTRVPGTQEG